MKKAAFLTALSLSVATLLSAAPPFAAPAFASDIRFVVNNVPVTSYDIQR
ncbi:MAG: molecular chaperone SurA, partial [Mesorhizobium amorphae]